MRQNLKIMIDPFSDFLSLMGRAVRYFEADLLPAASGQSISRVRTQSSSGAWRGKLLDAV